MVVLLEETLDPSPWTSPSTRLRLYEHMNSPVYSVSNLKTQSFSSPGTSSGAKIPQASGNHAYFGCQHGASVWRFRGRVCI